MIWDRLNKLLHVALNIFWIFFYFFFYFSIFWFLGDVHAPGIIFGIPDPRTKRSINIFVGQILEYLYHFLSIWCLVRVTIMGIGTLILIFSPLILYFICFGLKTTSFLFFLYLVWTFLNNFFIKDFVWNIFVKVIRNTIVQEN